MANIFPASRRVLRESLLGAPSGVAQLDETARVPAEQTSGNATFTATSVATMTGLSGVSKGDIAVRTDTSEAYRLRVLPASVASNWTLIAKWNTGTQTPGTPGGTDKEGVEDIVGALIVAAANSGITVKYNDPTDATQPATLVIGSTIVSLPPLTSGSPMFIPRINAAGNGIEYYDPTESIQDVVGNLLKAGTNVTLDYQDSSNKLVINSSGGSGGGFEITGATGTVPRVSANGGFEYFTLQQPPQTSSPELVGFLRPDLAPYNWKVFDPTATTPVENSWEQIAKDANAQGKYIRIDQSYLIASTAYNSAGGNFFDNVSVRIFGKGTLFVSGSTAVRQIIKQSPQSTITAHGRMLMKEYDDSTSNNSTLRRTVEYIKVPMSHMRRYKADTVWELVADADKDTSPTAGYYNWSYVGTNTNALLDGAVVMAEAFPVQGVSIAVNGGKNAAGVTFSTSTIAENKEIVGVDSGAKMMLIGAEKDITGTTSSPTYGPAVRATARGMTGEFQDGEVLKIGTTEVGTYQAGSALVLRKGLGLYSFSGLGVDVFARKMGGSEKGYGSSPTYATGDWSSNLESDISGINFDTRTNIQDPAFTSRAAMIDIRGAVQFNHRDLTIKSTYKQGFYYVGCYGGVTANCVVDVAPNIAVASIAGFGYGIEYAGASEACIARNCRFSNLRHGITQNPTPNSAYISNANDTWRHGIQRGILIDHCVAIDCWSAGFDTHQAGEEFVFAYCTVINGGTSIVKKDSGEKCFNDRSNSTTYIGCRAVGGRIGFSTSAPGFHATFASRTRYYDCKAEGYQEAGFISELRSRTSNKSLLYQNCEAISGLRGASGTGTTGFRVGLTNTVFDGCRGVNNDTMIEIIHGRVDEQKKDTPTAVQPPADTYAATVSIVNGFTADYSTAAFNADHVISAVSSTSGKLTLALPGDIVVIKRPGNSTSPGAVVEHGSGSNITIQWGGKILSVGDSTKLTAFTSSGSGTATHARVPEATLPAVS